MRRTTDATDAVLAPAPLERCHALLTRAVASGDCLGVTVFVARRSREVLDAALGRRAPLAPAEPGDVGELRCVVKAVIACSVVRAAHRISEGGVDALDVLDTPVGRWLPELADSTYGPVTARSLLSHTAGVPNLPRVPPQEIDDARFVEQLATERRSPGAAPTYNLLRSWRLLAVLATAWTGITMTDLVRELADEAGLDSLRLTQPHGTLARSHKRTSAGFELIDDPDMTAAQAVANPGFGGFATTADVGRFYLELLASGRGEGTIVPAAALPDMTRSHGRVRYSSARHRFAYGLGFYLGPDALGLDNRWGARTFGGIGGVGRYNVNLVAADPDSGIVLSVRFANAGRGNNALWTQVSQAVLDDLAGV